MLPDLLEEFEFRTSRSSGPGGQNVNKVNSRVELRFNIAGSMLLSDTQKAILLSKLAPRLTADGFLAVVCQQDRSQLRNRQTATAKIYHILEAALKPVRKRKPTAPTMASIERRLERKHYVAEKKTNREKINYKSDI
ncbi:MAG: aminoacyl-tRNA hydrolase [Bacteroidales bacterium]|jgi:ribosome-associated protein|nr:aminoacyl-tRNA hydrolase [Bacteroidales bacterium]